MERHFPWDKNTWIWIQNAFATTLDRSSQLMILCRDNIDTISILYPHSINATSIMPRRHSDTASMLPRTDDDHEDDHNDDHDADPIWPMMMILVLIKLIRTIAILLLLLMLLASLVPCPYTDTPPRRFVEACFLMKRYSPCDKDTWTLLETFFDKQMCCRVKSWYR